MSDQPLLGFGPAELLKLARWTMPFGKYQGRALIDLPEEYLFWFQRRGFPGGELGELMKLCLDLRIAGLEGLIKAMPNQPDESPPASYDLAGSENSES